MTTTTEQLKDLLAKVTPGDWAWRDVGLYDEGYTYAYLTNGVSTGRRDDTECIVGSSEWLEVNEHDATLIALAPTLAAEVVRLRTVVEDALACLQFEINPSNYDHDDACRLNDNSCEAYAILAGSICMADGHAASALDAASNV